MIQRFSKNFDTNYPVDILGIGDDCAVYPGGSQPHLVTTDMLVEDVHFIRNKINARDLGYKSLAVNLSDIAAMAAYPKYCFLSLALPGEIEIEWVDDFFQGLRELAEESGTLLLGGDTTRSTSGVIINITVIGSTLEENIKYRSTAQTGDVIFTTGFTGESGAGLKQILDNNRSYKDKNDSELNKIEELKSRLIQIHNRPRPHLKEGCFLGKQDSVHAMMDVSDGIDSDLRHILNASKVLAELQLDKIPLSENLMEAEDLLGIDPLLSALTAGEDYCLIGTASSKGWDRLNEEYMALFNRPLNQIGVIKNGSAMIEYWKAGQQVQISKSGFDHFKSIQKKGKNEKGI